MDLHGDFHVYDTTLRDGAQQEGLNLSVADKLSIARQLDGLGVGLHRGRLAGGEPQGHRVLPAGRGRARPAQRQAGGVRRDPPGRREGRRRPAGRRAARQRRERGDAGREVARPARRAGAADHARGEPRDDPRHRHPPARGGADGLPRRRALLRRLPRQPRLRARGAAHGVRRRRRGDRAVRHQRRDAAGLGRRRRARRARERPGAGRHPLPQRHRLRGRQHPGRRRRRRDARAGHDQRVRRAHRQRRPGRGRRQPRAQAGQAGAAAGAARRGDPDRARGRRGHELPARVAAAVRRQLGVHAQGRPARQRDQGRPEPLPAHGPGRRRQRHAAAGLRHGRPRVDRAQGPRARLRPVRRPRAGHPDHRPGQGAGERAATRSRPPTRRSSCC